MISFEASRLKVQRANQHISDINRSFLTFQRRDPYVVIVDTKSEPGYQLLRIVERFRPPVDWPLILGDAIHNLRSALDHLACDVMRHHKRGIASVHFPFSSVGADDLEAVIEKRTVHRARPEVVALFRELKPYKGGDDVLFGIHDLDIRDKHKLMIPVVHLVGVRSPKILRPDGSLLMESQRGATILIDSEDRIIFKAELGFNFEYDRKPAFEIRFGIGTLSQKPVIPTLFQMAQLVSKIIDRFESAINSPRAPILLGFSA